MDVCSENEGMFMVWSHGRWRKGWCEGEEVL